MKNLPVLQIEVRYVAFREADRRLDSAFGRAGIAEGIWALPGGLTRWSDSPPWREFLIRNVPGRVTMEGMDRPLWPKMIAWRDDE